MRVRVREGEENNLCYKEGGVLSSLVVTTGYTLNRRMDSDGRLIKWTKVRGEKAPARVSAGRAKGAAAERPPWANRWPEEQTGWLSQDRTMGKGVWGEVRERGRCFAPGGHGKAPGFYWTCHGRPLNYFKRRGSMPSLTFLTDRGVCQTGASAGKKEPRGRGTAVAPVRQAGDLDWGSPTPGGNCSDTLHTNTPTLPRASTRCRQEESSLYMAHVPTLPQGV